MACDMPKPCELPSLEKAEIELEIKGKSFTAFWPRGLNYSVHRAKPEEYRPLETTVFLVSNSFVLALCVP